MWGRGKNLTFKFVFGTGKLNCYLPGQHPALLEKQEHSRQTVALFQFLLLCVCSFKSLIWSRHKFSFLGKHRFISQDLSCSLNSSQFLFTANLQHFLNVEARLNNWLSVSIQPLENRKWCCFKKIFNFFLNHLKQGKESWCTMIDFGVLDVIMKQSSQAVGPCDLMLGRVPLFPLFLKGKNSCSRWQLWEQRVWGQPVAVAVWALEVVHSGPVRVWDRGKAHCCQ